MFIITYFGVKETLYVSCVKMERNIKAKRSTEYFRSRVQNLEQTSREEVTLAKVSEYSLPMVVAPTM